MLAVTSPVVATLRAALCRVFVVGGEGRATYPRPGWRINRKPENVAHFSAVCVGRAIVAPRLGDEPRSPAELPTPGNLGYS